MKQRTITGMVLALLCAVLLCCFHFPWVPQITAIALGFGAVWEILNVFEISGKLPRLCCLAFAVVWPLVPLGENKWLMLAMLVLGLCFFTYLMGKIGQPKERWMAYGAILFAVGLYRALAAYQHLSRAALALCLTGVICAMTDSFAYLVGSRFGRHKLAPKVSPGKSIEGALGALVITVPLVTMVVAPYLGGPWIAALYVCVCSILGQWGDLSMSALKRIAGVKDFGRIFPGHGGILDRCDSLIYPLAFTWVLYSFLG